MQTVVFTGATSFLGRNLINGLLKNGYKVYALIRENSAKEKILPQEKNLIKLYGSLQNMQSIKDEVESADIFMHFAWDGSGNEGRANTNIQEKNVEYAKNAFEIAKSLKCQMFLFPGSQAEYGPKYYEIYEDDACNPISAYGKAKLAFSRWAMNEVQNNNMQFVHLRIFSVYGYGDRTGTLTDSCVRKMNQNRCIHLGSCTQQWNYLYINDFVSIVLKLVSNKCGTGIYNIASKDTRVLKEFVEEIYAYSNKSGEYKFDGTVSNPEKSPNLIPNVDKMMKIVGGIQFTKFKDGIIEIMNMISREEK